MSVALVFFVLLSKQQTKLISLLFLKQIPLCEVDTEKGLYEEQLVRWAHTTADVDVKTARETALKLFAVSIYIDFIYKFI